MSTHINDKQRSKIFNAAILFALRKNKVHGAISQKVRSISTLSSELTFEKTHFWET